MPVPPTLENLTHFFENFGKYKIYFSIFNIYIFNIFNNIFNILLSFELASSHARVTSIKFTKQELVSDKGKQ